MYSLYIASTFVDPAVSFDSVLIVFRTARLNDITFYHSPSPEVRTRSTTAVRCWAAFAVDWVSRRAAVAATRRTPWTRPRTPRRPWWTWRPRNRAATAWVPAHTVCNRNWWTRTAMRVASPGWTMADGGGGSRCAGAVIARRNTTCRIRSPCTRTAFCAGASACVRSCGHTAWPL